MGKTDEAAAAQPDFHIIDETEDSLLVAMRITKSSLAANHTFLLALLELANLLKPDS